MEHKPHSSIEEMDKSYVRDCNRILRLHGLTQEQKIARMRLLVITYAKDSYEMTNDSYEMTNHDN